VSSPVLLEWRVAPSYPSSPGRLTGLFAVDWDVEAASYRRSGRELRPPGPPYTVGSARDQTMHKIRQRIRALEGGAEGYCDGFMGSSFHDARTPEETSALKTALQTKLDQHRAMADADAARDDGSVVDDSTDDDDDGGGLTRRDLVGDAFVEGLTELKEQVKCADDLRMLVWFAHSRTLNAPMSCVLTAILQEGILTLDGVSYAL
jgi:hypothetical protein